MSKVDKRGVFDKTMSDKRDNISAAMISVTQQMDQ